MWGNFHNTTHPKVYNRTLERKKMGKENAKICTEVEEQHKDEFNSNENHSSDSIDGSPPNSASGITDIILNPIERHDDDKDTSNLLD